MWNLKIMTFKSVTSSNTTIKKKLKWNARVENNNKQKISKKFSLLYHQFNKKILIKKNLIIHYKDHRQ